MAKKIIAQFFWINEKTKKSISPPGLRTPSNDMSNAQNQEPSEHGLFVKADIRVLMLLLVIQYI